MLACRMSDAPVKLLDRLFHAMPSRAGEQVVVLSQVLADEATLGYEDFTNVQVSQLMSHRCATDS